MSTRSLDEHPPLPAVGDEVAQARHRRAHVTAKPTVIYIEGFGRSGTTLLDAALGQIDGFFSLGELAFLWDRGHAPGEICSCGAPATRCPIWSEALDAVLDGCGATAAQIAGWRDEAFPRRDSLLAGTRTLDQRIRARSGGYLDATSICYRKVAEITGAEVLVDSSKSPAYRYLAHLLPDITVHTIHAVRDPRAVAFSWQRDRASEKLPARPVKRTAREWTLGEGRAELLRKRQGAGCTIVRYEDFIADPRREIGRILEGIHQDGKSLGFLGDGRIHLEPNHIVCGNPSRFRSGTIDLKPDSEWKTEMHSRDVASVTAVGLPWIARYGYPILSARRKTTG